ncbi:MAG: DNA-directed RNA polymerase subunit alpha [Patescibacteria group bacterium]|nr:DNA-directed RNA polymerase subunit alpha [Patescibacteria group bacterium]
MDNLRFGVDLVKEKDNCGRVVISPLPKGFGDTVGNSLRRVLLSSLSGAAVIQMKVKGATHLFSALEGVKEDLVEVMLNVKQIKVAYQGEKPVTLKLEKKGPGQVKASDLHLQPGVSLANPDLVLASLTDKKTVFKMELVVVQGVGYEMAEEHESNRLGVIGIDAVFSPIKRVNYQVEAVRRGKQEHLDQLVLDIWTDGSLKAITALEQASEILVSVFKQILEPQEAEAKEEEKPENHDLDLLIEEIEDIPLRLANALKKSGYRRISDLVDAGTEKIAGAKNVGAKSIDLLKKVLKKRDIEIK